VTAYILRRVLISVLVVFCVSTLVFLMIHLVPGDPVQIMLTTGGTGAATAEDAERLREQLGLNDPLHVQYGRYLSNVVRGDLGRSIYSRRGVAEEILEQLPHTLQLAFAGMGLAIIVGVTVGIISGTRPNTLVDHLSMVFALFGVSMPEFWLGLMLIFVFCVRLNWFPITGYGGLKRLVLPALVLGLVHAAFVARLTRSSLIEVMRQEYIVTARAKGLKERLVVGRHALKNAMIPVITILGLQFGTVLSGAVVIETVFARQGIGRLAVTAILQKDFPVVQGVVLFIALGYVLTNLLVDMAYSLFDPRVRHE
jgi:peptide/nickel transport system permease protein